VSNSNSDTGSISASGSIATGDITIIAALSVAGVLLVAIALLYFYNRRSSVEKRKLNDESKMESRQTLEMNSMYENIEGVVTCDQPNVMRQPQISSSVMV